MHDLIVVLPDKLKIWWIGLRARFDAFVLRQIDKYLANHDEERTSKLLEFDELPILYDFADFTVVPGDINLNSGIIAGWKYAPPSLQDETGVL